MLVFAFGNSRPDMLGGLARSVTFSALPHTLHFRTVHFCSLAVLDPRVGHTFAQLITFLCYY